jgi:hypothetical protein
VVTLACHVMSSHGVAALQAQNTAACVCGQVTMRSRNNRTMLRNLDVFVSSHCAGHVHMISAECVCVHALQTGAPELTCAAVPGYLRFFFCFSFFPPCPPVLLSSLLPVRISHFHMT